MKHSVQHLKKGGGGIKNQSSWKNWGKDKMESDSLSSEGNARVFILYPSKLTIRLVKERSSSSNNNKCREKED